MNWGKEPYCKEINSALFENLVYKTMQKQIQNLFCLMYKLIALSLWSKWSISVFCSDFLKGKTWIVLKKVL